MEQLRSEIRELEFHVERTRMVALSVFVTLYHVFTVFLDEYISTIGKWHVQIPNCEV